MVNAARVPLIGGLLQRSNYAYANARVRVRKAKLLPRETYQKLLKMDIPEITRFIQGTEYGREIDELATKFRGIDLLENALNVNEERNYAEVEEFAAGEVGDLVKRYLERFNFWNIKTILRGRHWGAKASDLVSELLMENRDEYDFYQTLINAEGQGLKGVVDVLASSAQGAPVAKILKDAVARVPDESRLLQAYEDALDRAYYEGLLQTIDPHSPENKLFLQFVRREIDVRNLQLLLRVKARGEAPPNLLEHFLEGGQELTMTQLRRLAEAPNFEELVERLKDLRIYQDVRTELDAYPQTKSLTPVMIALTRSLAAFAQKFAYLNPLSVLPIINYLMRKHLEIRNLRAIARGKQAGLSEEEIERLLVVI